MYVCVFSSISFAINNLFLPTYWKLLVCRHRLCTSGAYSPTSHRFSASASKIGSAYGYRRCVNVYMLNKYLKLKDYLCRYSSRGEISDDDIKEEFDDDNGEDEDDEDGVVNSSSPLQSIPSTNIQ